MHAESSMIGGVLGGLGLLLLGMRLMTDGLRLAAGDRLRALLERATGGRLRALLTGALITSLVQSSSVVTVATLGFVNAGILALHNALWVIFGSNVGTTMTGWLVALTGLDFDLEALALPLVGAGALLQLVGFRRRGASAGALAGFGLFFLGLGVIRDAFGGMAPSAALGGEAGWLGDLAALGIGLVATFVTQSSSASIALTISAAAAGLLSLDAAGAMVIGANLGTTSTAILATLRATPNARRAAAAHVVFNLLAASVALVLLPWLLDLLQALLGRGQAPAVASTLALFHTTFNLLGVVLIWPLSQKLEEALGRRFVSEGELESRPRFLDDTVLAIPALALEATRREMGRVAHLALHLHLDAIRTPAPTVEAIATRREGMAALLQAISRYIARLSRADLPAAVADGLEILLRASQHLVIAGEQATAVIEQRQGSPEYDRAIPGRFAAFLEGARAVGEAADPTALDHQAGAARHAFALLDQGYEAALAALLRETAAGKVPPAEAIWDQHLLAEIRRAAKHLARAATSLDASSLTGGAAQGSRPDPQTGAGALADAPPIPPGAEG